VPLRNIAPERRFAFAFDDVEWLRAAREADALGLEVLGIAHSHVDAAAAPSAVDRAFGDATPWMLIVPVVAGAPAAPRAWQRLAAGGWCEAALRSS
jgi:proteasome lid subunit RPN8/RPN11